MDPQETLGYSPQMKIPGVVTEWLIYKDGSHLHCVYMCVYDRKYRPKSFYFLFQDNGVPSGETMLVPPLYTLGVRNDT